jgi:predicted metalloendopeptidase
MIRCIVIGIAVNLLSVLGFGTVQGAEKIDVDLSIIDHSTNPCEDFYQFACGGWLQKTEIPSDRAMWSRSFSTIDLNNQEILKAILTDYSRGGGSPSNPHSGLLGDFYSSCMNEQNIEAKSLGELQNKINDIDLLKDIRSLAPLLAQLHRRGVQAFFEFGQEQDAKNSSLVIGVADQGGLGLPDRDFYLKDESKMSQIRQLYREHIKRVFKLLDLPRPDSAPDTILSVETALAKVSMSRVDRRKPEQVYHRLDRKGLIQRVPDFDWAVYLKNLDPHATDELQAINVVSPEFFTGLNQLLKTVSLDEVKTYLKWHFVSAYWEALPKRLVEEHFQFVSNALTGQKKLEERWKRCVRLADRSVGFALGRAFVEVAYGKSGKEQSQNMIHDIENQFRRDLKSLKWMDESTRLQADLKLSKVNNKVGYPNQWRSYQGLIADRNSFLETLIAAQEFDTHYELSKIGKPVDPHEWQMTPSTVNAYYDAQRNEMVFPAGILQYPFFSPLAPDWLNYGAMGLVMGHELTHGYDDAGRHFDAHGNLRNWWSKKVLAEFEVRTACVVNEYNAFEVFPGVHVNGELTLGENIADQGGMRLAYYAWKKLQKENLTLKAAEEYSADQKFFLAFAQSWCQKEQEQYTRTRITVDPHSPSRFRVNGVVSQFEPFASAYSCASGSKMAPTQTCAVW